MYLQMEINVHRSFSFFMTTNFTHRQMHASFINQISENGWPLEF